MVIAGPSRLAQPIVVSRKNPDLPEVPANPGRPSESNTTPICPLWGRGTGPSLRVVVRALDHVAVELGKRDEWHDPSVIDVGAGDGEGSVLGLVLHHLE